MNKSYLLIQSSLDALYDEIEGLTGDSFEEWMDDDLGLGLKKPPPPYTEKGEKGGYSIVITIVTLSSTSTGKGDIRKRLALFDQTRLYSNSTCIYTCYFLYRCFWSRRTSA